MFTPQAHARDGDPAAKDGRASASVHEGQGDLQAPAGLHSPRQQEDAGEVHVVYWCAVTE